MKKVILILASLMLASCSQQEICEDSNVGHLEVIGCDTEDNLIKIDNSSWLHNSNLNWSQWEYYQDRGFQLNQFEFVVTTNNDATILCGKLVDVDPTFYTTLIKDPHTIVFQYKTNLINAGDLVYVKLKTL